MTTWRQRIRGALGIAITWAFAWSAVGLVPRLLLGFNPDAPFPIIFGVLGFAAGLTFATLVFVTQRRRRFDEISMPRFAGWGAAGGLLLGALFAKAASLDAGDILAVVPIFTVASAACASASLALARRAQQHALDGALPISALPSSHEDAAHGAPSRQAVTETLDRR